MTIVLASSYAFTEEPGGVKDFILGLRTALQRAGCEVFIVAPGSKDALKKNEIDFILGADFKVAADQTEFRVSFSRKETAREILLKIKPDIIVIHEPFLPSIGHSIISALSGIKDGKKTVVIGQFHASKKDVNWQFRAAEFIGRHIIRRLKLNGATLGLSSGYLLTIDGNLDGRIAVSNATKNFWQKKFPAKYKVIYNGIDTRELTPDGARIEEWIEEKSRIILFAGRHDVRKGIDDLIEAIKLLVQGGQQDIRLKIAGEGEMTGAMQELVKKLKLTRYVQFVGVLPRNELVKAYRTADLTVAPSIGGEGFNRTIIEARSCGSLVVCTDIEGQNEAVGEDLVLFMAKPRNPRSLSKQITRVLNLPLKKKQEISQRGREEVKKNFDWNKIASEHLAYYQSLLAKC